MPYLYLWLMLIVFRLGWSIFPQTSYIHPDEFFQSVEVVAGDALNISVVHTWEFTSDYPLRSIVLQQALFYPVFKLLQYADQVSFLQLNGSQLLVSYRLLMAVLSLWIDYCVHRISHIAGGQDYSAVFILASSYVTLTFQTHTFSNSFETLLFATLLLLIFEYVKCDSEESTARSHLNYKEITEIAERRDDSDSKNEEMDLDSSFDSLHKMAFQIRKRNTSKDKFNDGKTKLEKQSVEELKTSHICSVSRKEFAKSVYVILAAIVISVGVFNRPTFILFSIVPLVWWLDQCFTGSKPELKICVLFMSTGLFSSFTLSVCDTLYFKKIAIGSLLTLQGWKTVSENIVITPLNFFFYNTSSENLKTHGEHPFYLHMLVNMPLLYGPMLCQSVKIYFYKSIIFIKRMLSKKVFEKEKTFSNMHISVLRKHLQKSVIFFILLPVVFLSFFPHQEARFLIPLLPLLVLSKVLFSENLSKLFLTMHILFNLCLCVVFGVLHQGGVTPCLFHLQRMNLHDSKTVYIIFSHTYMPPKHLLLSKPHVEFIDLKGSSIEIVCQNIRQLYSQKHEGANDSRTGLSRLFLALPGTLRKEFDSRCGGNFIASNQKFFPHLSLEDPPDFRYVSSFNEFVDVLSLHLLEFE